MGEGEQKAPLRVHLESLARQGDEEAIADLASIPELPHHCAHVWLWWTQVAARRPSNGMSILLIPDEVVEAWARRECIRMELWERRLLAAIDEAYVRINTNGKPDPKPEDEDDLEDC